MLQVTLSTLLFLAALTFSACSVVFLNSLVAWYQSDDDSFKTAFGMEPVPLRHSLYILVSAGTIVAILGGARLLAG